jgi:hypothetical protein
MLLMLPGMLQGQFTFTTNNGAITITGYSGPGGAVIIPPSTNGFPVTGIGDYAFSLSTSMTAVSIPDSVTSIGASAFIYCYSLASITIPASVTNIGEAPLAFCYDLTAITVAPPNSSYFSTNGVLFDASQTTLIQYPAGKAGSYTIPTNVANIGPSGFAGCTTLADITLPGSLTNIGANAFGDCGALKGITVEAGNPVYSSLNGVLFDTSQTMLIQYPAGKAGSYTIPGSVTSIAESAFDACFSLTSVTIPNSVTNIGEAAFFNCGALVNVTIPASVSNIGDGAFAGCPGMTAIMVNATNSFYSSVNGVLFDKSQATLVAYPDGLVGSYTIPTNVTSIGNDAFDGCSLAGVVIPDSVTNIGNIAFAYCSNLKNVLIPGSVTSIGYYAFQSCSSLSNAYFTGNPPAFAPSVFPGDNVTVYYLPGATGWASTFQGFPAVLWNPLIQAGGAGFGVRTDEFRFNITGTNDFTVVVEASTSLTDPTWSPLQTLTLTNGSAYFSDPQWTNYPARFYRLVMP